ncbi:ATP-binding cassette domain-containing protein, partial [Isoptericola sp. NPDC057559]|uniref:ATP-binding cassette domain-containing protein n=1 Tax=Isoptericola sp. NPDC057559 TaxID=3346168 RepID=UPI0036CEA410
MSETVTEGGARAGAPAIELRGVSKTFGDGDRAVHAVVDVSLTVQAGEIFGVIGYSGAGKSTLVRLVNALETVTSGTVLVEGTDITALP